LNLAHEWLQEPEGEVAVQKILAASAIVYIPAGRPVGLCLARQYWAYLQRRGYKFYAVDRDLDHALGDLDSGKAQVVVMPTAIAAERAEPGMTTVIDLSAKRDRMLANDPTVRLRPCADQLLDDTAGRWTNDSQAWRRRIKTPT
jgi:hypothetical protein